MDFIRIFRTKWNIHNIISMLLFFFNLLCQFVQEKSTLLSFVFLFTFFSKLNGIRYLLAMTSSMFWPWIHSKVHVREPSPIGCRTVLGIPVRSNTRMISRYGPCLIQNVGTYIPARTPHSSHDQS